MISFEQVMALTSTISSHTAFEDAECRAYYDLLCALKPGSTVVEIGLQFGRSTSIALQVAKESGLTYIGIDPFTDPPDARDAWIKLANRIYPGNFILLERRSGECGQVLLGEVNLALIDGDHTEGGVRIDCQLLMPRIAVGGYLLFHDYSRESLPDVYPTVNSEMVAAIMAGGEWEEEPTVGCLGIWRKM